MLKDNKNTDGITLSIILHKLFLTPIKSHILWAFVSVICVITFLQTNPFFSQTLFSLWINGFILFILMAALFYYFQEMIIITDEIGAMEQLKLKFKDFNPEKRKDKIIQSNWENNENQGIIVQVMHVFKNKINHSDTLVSDLYKAGEYPNNNTSFFENSAIFLGMSGTLIELARDNSNAQFACVILGIFVFLILAFFRNIYENLRSKYQKKFHIFYTLVLSPIILEKPERIELKHISEQLQTGSEQLCDTTNSLDNLIKSISHKEGAYHNLANQLVEIVSVLVKNQQDINSCFEKLAASTEHFIKHARSVEIKQSQNSDNFEKFVNTLSDVKSLQDSFNQGIYDISGSLQSKVINKAQKVMNDAERLAKQREIQTNDTLKRMNRFLEQFEETNRKVIDKLSQVTKI